MKLTKKQRNKLYLKVSKYFTYNDRADYPNIDLSGGLCYWLNFALKGPLDGMTYLKGNPILMKIVPELSLFQPYEGNRRDYWWHEDDNTNKQVDDESRAMCLAFMIAMTEN